MLMGAGLFVSLNLLYSQDAASPFQLDSATVAGMSDLEVELKAVESVPPMPADSLPDAGTFWSAQHAPGTAEEWPPLPTSFGMGAWSLGDDGVYLLADLNHVYGHPIKSKKASLTATASVGGIQTISVMSAMDLNPGDGGDDGDTNSDSGNIAPEFSPAVIYGTNLWLAITNLSGGTAGFVVSNTVADVQYEIQSKADLLQTNWNSMGFFYGSEITNWNAASATATNYPNLFYRIRSWQSSDGSGIPDWWELKYFGTTGIDPYADPDGDGWNNLQEFQNGTDPTVFNTSPAPQGVTVTYNSTNGTVTVSWLPSPGSVSGYTVNMNGTDYTVSSSTFSYTNALSTDDPYVDPVDEGPIPLADFQVQANYGGGNSTWSGVVPFEANPTSVPAYLVPGAQGSVYLSVACLPPDTATLRLLRIDVIAHEEFNDSSFDTSLDVPVSDITNGLYELPASWNATPVIDGYGDSEYIWWLATVTSNGATNGSAVISDNNGEYYGGGNYDDAGNNYNNDYASGQRGSWTEPPYFDGREQIKQNLAFLLRAGLNSLPFQFNELASNGSGQGFVFNFPTNYAYAGYYEFTYASGYAPWAQVGVFLPFGENYLYKNFAFDLSDMSSFGLLKSFTNNFNYYGDGPEGLNAVPTYKFQAPTNNGVAISPVLSTNETRWLLSFVPYQYNTYAQIGIIQSGSTNGLASGVANTFGLPFLSTELAWGNTSPQTATLYPGDSTTQDAWLYAETAQPQLQKVEYDFWNPITDTLPGMPGFSTTNAGHLMIAAVGNPFTPAGNNFQVAGYAKMAVENGYSGVYGYLGQYFDKAYQMTNGVATTNTTGVVSPYGDFFATQAGPAALVTMPDPDTGARGTCTVYCVSLQLDANHDGNMDLSFNGPDATSQSSPMEFWVNNGNIKSGINGNLDRDLPVPQNPPNYSAGQITCQRDLENFARLWICGMPSLPSSQGYSVTLTCNEISGSPAINLYTDEGDGGISYLTNSTVAESLVHQQLLRIVSPYYTYTFPANFFDGSNKYFMFEGAGIGEGQFTLTIYQNGNIIAQTSAYIDLHDIKDYYERAVITDNTGGAISTWSSSIETVQHPVATISDEDSNIIVFVHGINVGNWDWLNDSDTVFKRLYWAGYQGKFATVDWPCEFFNLWTLLNVDTMVFNDSEIKAYKASTSLKNYLSGLRTRFPNDRLNIFAHSQGNAVASEAIKNGAPFDTYILTQGAMPDSAYDVGAPTYDGLVADENTYGPTPEWQPMGYRGVYTNANFAGNIVNFYNTNDPVLAFWQSDQGAAKPNVPISDYHYDGMTVTYEPPFGSSYTVTDSEESRAYASRSRTLSIGQSPPESGHGVIQLGIDLTAQFGFNKAFPDDHSAQWTWPIQTTLPYYQLILLQIQPAP